MDKDKIVKYQNIQFKIGKSTIRKDAFTKVSGKEKYTADFYGDNLLWAGAKRADIAHGKIRKIYIDEAVRLKGVVKILTSKDVKGSNRYGVVEQDQPVLADDKVRHCGDPVALVIAENKAIMEEAINLIKIDYEVLPVISSIKEALKDDAVLIHDNRAEGNLLLKGSVKKGEFHDVWQQCDKIVEAEFNFCHQEHACLETECGWGIVRENGILEIIASTQTPFRDRVELAHSLGLDPENIRVIAPYCGGAFGGKDGITVQALLGLAAINCPGRPVKIWCSREESILSSPKRHPAQLYYRLGAKADGEFHALEVEAYYDTGPYDHLGVAVMTLGLEHSGGPYKILNTRLKAWAVYTNNPIGGPFRGFGVPQVTGAMEQVVDMMAAELGICPMELRMKNILRKGDINPVGMQLFSSTGIADCLETIKNHQMWQTKDSWMNKAGSFKKRGVGISAVMQGMGYGPVIPDTAEAKIKLTKKGKFRIYAGVVDMGQGNASTYLQIAGSILNQDMAEMELVLPDTNRTLPSGSSAASRTTYTFGNALIEAARAMKKRILLQAAERLNIKTTDNLQLESGIVKHLESGKEISLVGLLDENQRIITHRFQSPSAEQKVNCDEKIRTYGIPHCIFSYGAHLAMVEVDMLTGQVEVLGYLAATDCGKLINPDLFEQQMHGGIAQGIGYALYEDFVVNKGRIATKDLSTYILPSSLDIPDMESIAVETKEPSGPFGLKGAGEVAMNGPLPAIANAITNACGLRIFSSPVTGEKIIKAMIKEKESGDLKE